MTATFYSLDQTVFLADNKTSNSEIVDQLELAV
jgi:hypothetical protein